MNLFRRRSSGPHMSLTVTPGETTDLDADFGMQGISVHFDSNLGEFNTLLVLASALRRSSETLAARHPGSAADAIARICTLPDDALASVASEFRTYEQESNDD